MSIEEWSNGEHSELVRLFVQHIGKLPVEQQIEEIQRLIGIAVSHMPDHELFDSKTILQAGFPADIPYVMEIINIVEGQIALRDMGYKPA
jgi:hypothetical protein